MRKTSALLALGLCLFLLGACAKPVRDGEEEGVAAARQWISRYQEQFTCRFWPEATVDDATLTGPGWNFTEAWENRAESQQSADWRATFNVFSAELAAMSTRNLARTCYIYPYNFDYLATEDDYLGVLAVISNFNGWQELMRRKSAPEELLLLFEELRHPVVPGDYHTPLDYTEYLDDYHNYMGIEFLSLVIATAVDCHKFSRGQAARLAAEVERKLSDLAGDSELYSYTGHLRQEYLLGAFLACHYDDGLSGTDRQVLSNYLDPYSLTEEYGIVYRPGIPIRLDPASGLWYEDAEAINKAMAIISSSLNRLKQQ